MNQHAAVNKFSHNKPGDTEYTGGGLRDFFLYRDLGIADATGGQVICHLVKANPDCPPVDGTGWHRHDCEFQIVIMMKGWARFMYDVAGLHQRRLVLVHEARPALHHDHDLEFAVMAVPAGAVLRRTIAIGLDEMADHLAAGRIGNAEVAIQEEVAQTSARVAGIAG